jgi:osmotically-inducible protein OsmY
MYRLPKLFLCSILLSVAFLQGCIAAAAGGAATGASIATDRRTTGTIVDDQSIELKATYALSQHKELWKASHISVICYNNVLLLVGQTPVEAYKQEAEEAVSDIAKIRQIHNEITITEPASLGTRSNDSWITTQVKTKLIGNKAINAGRIKVVTEESVVYLMGITTPEEEMIATNIAQEISGVDRVVQIFEAQNP